LSNKKRIGVDEKIGIKTPNQKEFHTPDVIAAGADMLGAVADKAIADSEHAMWHRVQSLVKNLLTSQAKICFSHCTSWSIQV
jgi:hypothetical protein